MNAAVVLAPDFHEIEDEFAECLHVIQVLGREADHRVKLDLVEPARERVFGGIVHVLVADCLVDHLADTFGTCFRCERGATTAFERCYFFGETLSKTVDADTREAYVYVVIKRVVDDGIRERFDRLVVCGRKRQKSKFAFTSRLNARFCNIQNIVRVEFAARPVPNARLAETAALSATAHHFHAKAIVDKLHIGNQVLDGIVFRVELWNELAAYTVRFFVRTLCGFCRDDHAVFVLDNLRQARHVNAVELGQVF